MTASFTSSGTDQQNHAEMPMCSRTRHPLCREHDVDDSKRDEAERHDVASHHPLLVLLVQVALDGENARPVV